MMVGHERTGTIVSQWNDQQGPSDPTGGDGGTGEPTFPSWTAPGSTRATQDAASDQGAPGVGDHGTPTPGHGRHPSGPDGGFRPPAAAPDTFQDAGTSPGLGNGPTPVHYRPGDPSASGVAAVGSGTPGQGGQPQPWDHSGQPQPWGRDGHVPTDLSGGDGPAGLVFDGRGAGAPGSVPGILSVTQHPGHPAYPGQPGGPYPTGVPQLWPGPIPLRPMDFGEILEAAFRVVRFNPRTLIGLSFAVIMITSVIALGMAFIVASFTGSLSAPMSDGNGGLEAQLASYAPSLVSVLLSGVLIVPIAEAALGRKLSAGESWARAKGRMWPLVGCVAIGLALGVIVFLPLLGFIAMSAISESAVALGLTLLVALPLTIAAVAFLSTRFSLAPAAIVLEGVGPVDGLRRSWRLTRGAFWRTFAIEFTVSMIVGVIVGILGAVVAAVLLAVVLGAVVATGGENADPSGLVMFLILALVSLISSMLSAVVQPLSSASVALIYLDRRFRTEALAVDLLAEAERQRASGSR